MTEPQKEKWRRFGRNIAGLLPNIAALLGGPAIGAGARIIMDHFGMDDPSEIEQVINNLSHEEILRLKEKDAEVRKQELQVEMNLQDNLTARLQSDNATNSRFVQFTRPGIAWLWTLVSVFVVLPAGLWWIPAEKEPLYQWVALVTIAVLGGIYAFYFGSRGLEKVAAILGNRVSTSPLEQLGKIFRKSG